MRNIIRAFKRFFIDWFSSFGSNIKVFNSQIYDNNNYMFAVNLNKKKHWLYSFIFERGFVNHKISIWGVNGYKGLHVLDSNKYKLFFTVENVHVIQSPWFKYRDLFLNDTHFDISLGFDYLCHPKYIRFPFWIQSQFTPSTQLVNIVSYCKSIEDNRLKLQYKKKFCAFICRTDYFGDRAYFADLVSNVENLNYPGTFRHNDDSLFTDYNDQKIEYLKQFKFNLCPENSDNKGYVTEKIFDAIKAGCIPIYWGSENKPEPEILNQSRILFLKLVGDNTEVLSKIKQLNEDELAYHEFVEQPIFNVDAPELIYAYFERLEQKIREIVK